MSVPFQEKLNKELLQYFLIKYKLDKHNYIIYGSQNKELIKQDHNDFSESVGCFDINNIPITDGTVKFVVKKSTCSYSLEFSHDEIYLNVGPTKYLLFFYTRDDNYIKDLAYVIKEHMSKLYKSRGGKYKLKSSSKIKTKNRKQKQRKTRNKKK